MAVYRPKYRDLETGELKPAAIYWYEFVREGKRHRGSTGVENKREAQKIEAAEKTNLARGLVGIAERRHDADPIDSDRTHTERYVIIPIMVVQRARGECQPSRRVHLSVAASATSLGIATTCVLIVSAIVVDTAGPLPPSRSLSPAAAPVTATAVIQGLPAPSFDQLYEQGQRRNAAMKTMKPVFRRLRLK